MLGETVRYINRPGLTLMGGVKALREGKIYKNREDVERRRRGQKKGTKGKGGKAGK